MKLKFYLPLLLLGICTLDSVAQSQLLKEIPEIIAMDKLLAKHPSWQFSEEAVIKTLEERVSQASRQAQQAEQDYWWSSYHYTTEKPIKDFPGLIQGNYAELYPEVPFLQNQQQISLYLAAKANREIAKTLKYRNDYREQFQAAIPRMKQTQRHFTHEPEQDMSWLADQISEDTQYLLLGERHYIIEIKNNITRLMSEIRQRQPQRPIFLLTEFLDAGVQWQPGDSVSSPEYLPIWQAAYEQGMTVLGLEHDIDISKEWVGVWATREGVRLRNRQWLQTIKEMRNKNPDALFIIYTGAGHIMYHEPYSLGKFLAGPQTYVATFYPDKGRDLNKRITYNTSYFDILSEGQHFPLERIISFDDREISQLVGFDAQFRVPVELWKTYKNEEDRWKIHEE